MRKPVADEPLSSGQSVGGVKHARLVANLASLLMVAVVLAGGLAIRQVIPNVGSPGTTPAVTPVGVLSAAEMEWCSSSEASGGAWEVGEAGATYLQMPRYPEGARSDARAQPRWPLACALAYQLWAVSDEEWDWCFSDENRVKFLAPAVVLLGMGENESAGTDTLPEAPGDDRAEYTQACRFAYRHWQIGDLGSLPSADDPSLP